VRLGLAVCLVIASLGCAMAQTQTPTVAPPTPLPSPLPRGLNYYSCVMNCDTRAGTCQGSCSVSNSPNTTFGATTAGARPDPGALSQCYLACTNQQLACKQACPH